MSFNSKSQATAYGNLPDVLQHTDAKNQMKVADFLGVEPAQVALAGIVFLLSFLLFGIGGNLITQLVGFVYQDFDCISSFTNFERHSAKCFCIQLARFL